METKTLPAGTTEYRDHLIVCVFDYKDGTGDYQVYRDEIGWIEPGTTLQKIKISIDESLSEEI